MNQLSSPTPEPGCEALPPIRAFRRPAQLLTTVTSRRSDEQPPKRVTPRSRTISKQGQELGGPRLIHRFLRFISLALAGALVGLGATGGAASAKTISAETASFETLAGRPQRITVGLSDSDGHILAGGSITFSFKAVQGNGPTIKAEATFQPIAGRQAPAGKARLLRPSEAIGVYAATVTLPSPGFWVIKINGPGISGETAVEAIVKPRLPAVGEPAPASHNLVAGAKGAPIQAIDSRAGDGDPIPDPLLHRWVIADVLAAHEPLVVVAATPVYCQSRFCGPVTDLAAKLAAKYPAVRFVHLEIWRDFEKKVLNKAAAEWILPKNGDEGREPWVWLVGRDGKIVARYDNVVGDAELEAAVAKLAKR